jgi:alpha-tubulin suppressor-like RCC1 family protein
LDDVIAIGTGLLFSCALEAEGTVLCWGGNEHGERGDDDLEARAEPMPVSIDAKVVSITVGSGHACAVTESSELYCWGRNPFGQVGDGSSSQGVTPTPNQVTALQPGK